MDTNQFFHGVVSNSDPASYNVQVEPLGGDNKLNLMQGIPLASVFASGLGFRDLAPIPAGATVFCVSVTPYTCYILGVVPDKDTANLDWPSRITLRSAGDGGYDKQNVQGYETDLTKQATYNNGRPTDVLEGEAGWSNEFGVAIAVLQQLAFIKGSELAQVQCHLLDDLVRVISHNFEHYTALGEFKIHHDGKSLIAELGATHLPGESLGVPQVTGMSAKPAFTHTGKNSIDDSDNFYDIVEDEKALAIERLKFFVGRIGDFFNLFLVRPDEEAQHALNGKPPATPDRGLMNMHLGTDGSIHVSTVTEAFIEKVNWIRVPQRVRSPDDPEGDDAEELEYDEKELFQFDDSKAYRSNPALYALQLRSYNAYLQQKYNYTNFDKHEKDFAVNKDEGNETPLDSINQVDPKTPVDFGRYQLRTSGLYLMKNGGVMIKDAWASAIVMEGGDIRIQPAKDLIMQPARNLVSLAGQYVSVRAKKDIDLSSTEGSIRTKAELCQYHYSHHQGIVLHSAAQAPQDPIPQGAALEMLGGVVIKADHGIYTYANEYLNRVTGNMITKAGKFLLETTGELTLKSEKQAFLLGKTGLYALSHDGGVYAVGKSSAVFAGKSTFLGSKDGTLGVKYDENSPYVDVIKGLVDTKEILAIANTEGKRQFQKEASMFRTDDKFQKLDFYWLDSGKYGLGAGDFISQTLAQQEDAVTGSVGLGQSWAEIDVNSTLPFPGIGKFDGYFVTCTLNNMRAKGQELVANNVDDLTSSPSGLVSTSLNSYKVK